jgi:hypothetical protein
MLTTALAVVAAAAVNPPLALSADVSGSDVFITGQNFGTQQPPTVTLGGTSLAVQSYSPTAIVARLPSSTAPASYVLVVQCYGTTGPLLAAGLVLTVGAAGAAGPQGPPGPAGATGPQGLAGLTGPMGPTGATGPQGLVGPSGAQGATGADGQSVAGSSEPVGSNCAYGGAKYESVSGVSYVCNGAPGASLTAVALTVGDSNCPYGGSRFSIDGGQTTYACNGAAGLAGAAGPQGPAGPQGATGPQGPAATIPSDLVVNTIQGDGTGLSNLRPEALRPGVASININGNAATATTATSFTGLLNGDVQGSQSNTMVRAIAGIPIDLGAPAAGQALTFTGTSWSPANTTPPNNSITTQLVRDGTLLNDDLSLYTKFVSVRDAASPGQERFALTNGDPKLFFQTTSSVAAGFDPANHTVFFSVVPASITNAMLQDSSVGLTAGTGLAGGGQVALGQSVTLSLANSGVTPGTYVNPTLTIDSQGRVLSASNGAIASTGSLTLYRCTSVCVGDCTRKGNLTEDPCDCGKGDGTGGSSCGFAVDTGLKSL